MSEKVRVKRMFQVEIDIEGQKEMRFYLRKLENESIGALIMKSNLMNSEGGLAKGINPSDV